MYLHGGFLVDVPYQNCVLKNQGHQLNFAFQK